MLKILKSLLLAGVAVAMLGAIVGIFVLLHFARDLPDVETAQNLELHQPLRVFARNGELIGEFGAERREPLAWQDVPDVLINAFLAAEDDRFFSHPGVDYQGLLRAAWVLATTGQKAQGGSTITMQLARNLFLSNEKSYTRKIREILLAFKLEQRFEKSEILRLYLNKIFLGQRAYGVAAAARIYYGKAVDELALDEAAMIAGLPKAPSAYNPVANPARARIRRDYVLRRMRELGMIRPEDEAQAREVPVVAALAPEAVTLNARYVAEMVRSELYQRYGKDIYTAGVEVATSIDAGLQQAAVSAVQDGIFAYDERHTWRGPVSQLAARELQRLRGLEPPDAGALIETWFDQVPKISVLRPGIVTAVTDEAWQFLLADASEVELSAEQIAWSQARNELQPGDIIYLRWVDELPRLAQVPEVQAALVALDPRDGALRAIVGGFDFFQSKFNRATQARRQPGSSFKPFLYSAALDSGMTAADVLNDAPVVFDDPALGGAWRPENYDGRFRGRTRLREALVRSSNLVSIRILERVGVSNFRNYVTRFGLSADHLPRDLSIALGSGTYSPAEIATAYGVLANGGYRIEPWHIAQIRTSDGEVVMQANPARVCPECLRQQDWERHSQEQARQTAAEVAEADRSTASAESEETAPVSTVTSENEGAVTPPPVAPQAIDPANAYIVADMLRDVIQRGTGRRAKALGRKDIAGKTGTTNEQRDAWFAGFHPDLAAVAWIGFDNLDPLGRGETGGRAALPIWMRFMEQALPELPQRADIPPAGVVTARIDPDTGRLSSQGRFELFLSGHLPGGSETETAADGQPGVTTSRDDSTDTVLEELF